MKTIATIAGVALLATSTIAQEVTGTTNSDANSSAQNSLIFEGDSGNTPAVGGFGGNNTAPCQAAYGIGLGQAGLGVGLSVPITKEFCKTMVETEFLVKLVQIKDPLQRKLAITRACMTRGTIQSALVQVGICKIKRKAATPVVNNR